jgi:hypothetical protein
MIAIVVLGIGVLSLAATFAAGITYMKSAQDDFIAQQKAQQAVESIFTARDMGLPFASIANTANGGIFLGGPQPLCDPGADGIIDTVDDNCNLPDSIWTPGADGVLGTNDDVRLGLGSFSRTVAIAPAGPGLNQITVTVNSRVGQINRQYQLVTNISSSF